MYPYSQLEIESVHNSKPRASQKFAMINLTASRTMLDLTKSPSSSELAVISDAMNSGVQVGVQVPSRRDSNMACN